MTYYYQKNNHLFIKTYVQPRAKKNAIVGLHDDSLKILIKALPAKDKANIELINFLADYLHLSPSTIEIISGHHSRKKLVLLKQFSEDTVNLLPKL